MVKKNFWLILLFLFFAPALCGAAENTCLRCHEQLKGPAHKAAGHNFADWKKSAHAEKGILCQACHGGNPGTMDPVKAHQGVLPSQNKNSSVHFQKIPETCGRCHVEEFTEFRKSVHHKMLQRSGKGPNCLTCHGAMATFVLTASDLERTCSLCHGKPTQAAKALSAILSLKNFLNVYQKNLPKDEKERAAMFQKRYQKIQQEWHSFDVVFVIAESEKLMKEIKAAMDRKPRKGP
ncbi:MAG: hypothetical protein HY466_01480 [Deltaproteobacteria bacterium]|nr:hypothetical protein [Deltaproteobacteria bacterium]